MQTLAIEKNKALQAHKNADSSGKKLLSDLFGPEVFNQKITDRIKTWEDAAECKGLDPISSLPYPSPANDHQEAINGFFKMTVITDVLNEEWIPNWNNTNQRKWYPWFDMRAGFAFSASDYVFVYSDACVGSRLCFHSEALAIYAGKQFTNIYKSYLTLPGHEN